MFSKGEGEEYRPAWPNMHLPVRKARTEYLANFTGYGEPSTEDFIKWLDETYGIKLHFAEDGYNLQDKIDVVDEQKYLVFTLKYM